MHGNRWDKELPVYIEFVKGSYGLVFSIEDSGNGFNINDKISDFRMGRKYYTNMGHDIRSAYCSIPFVFSWDKNGSRGNFMYKFSENK